jgi:hypothetical protein
MTVSNVSSSASSYLANTQNPYQTVKTTYSQLQQNLTAGNVPGAQQVYSALVKALQNSPIGQAGNSGTTAVLQSLISVGQALQSGNISDVQSAFTSLGQTINSAAQDTSSSSTSSTALTPAQLTATLVNQIMSASNGGSGASDPLLAALTGSSSSDTGSTDPLLNAMNASDNSSNSTDPLLSMPTSGVNILV